MSTHSWLALPALLATFLLSSLGGVQSGETPPATPAAAPATGQQPQRQITPAEAFTLLAGEAEKGNTAAMLSLGSMYEQGVGVARSFTKAMEWYRKAAALNVPEGYYNLGVCYEIGMGVTGNAAEAFHNFEKSAEMGLPQGLYKLASLYFQGNGVGKNEGWGVELLKRASAAGHAVAANDLGVIYFEGALGQTRDQNQAYEMFNRSAELGNAEAMKNLAVFYRDGIGRQADPAQELKWYQLAKMAGFPAAAVDPVLDKIKAGLTAQQIAAVDAEVEAWVKAFQARQAEKKKN